MLDQVQCSPVVTSPNAGTGQHLNEDLPTLVSMPGKQKVSARAGSSRQLSDIWRTFADPYSQKKDHVDGRFLQGWFNGSCYSERWRRSHPRALRLAASRLSAM